MKVGLVLEGGGNRALFTAGVLDTMLKNNIEVDTIIGVSAGALFGVNYFSEQLGRVLRYTTKYAKDKRYISYKNLLLTGNIVSKDFAYYKMNKELDVFDNEKFKKSNKDFYVVATNVRSGEAKYFKIEDPFNDMEKLRATSALPMFSKIINIDGEEYLDGAISDSIPLKRMMEEKCDKIIVVLTRPISYIKPKLDKSKFRFLKLKYRKYPMFVDKLSDRHLRYNAEIENIRKLEKEGKKFVIRPETDIDIDILERDETRINNVYQMGVRDCERALDNLKTYLKEVK